MRHFAEAASQDGNQLSERLRGETFSPSTRYGDWFARIEKGLLPTITHSADRGLANLEAESSASFGLAAVVAAAEAG